MNMISQAAKSQPPDDPGLDTPAEASEIKSEEERVRQQYESDLRARGEAAKAEDGQLPPGATHEETEDGKLVRRRFSAV